MPTTIRQFNSEGGFGVNQTPIISSTFDLKNVNTFELKNSNYTDASRKDYILKGTNTTILTLDGAALIPVTSGTINFITANIIGVNPTGVGYYSVKIESAASCSASGIITILSELVTIIKDSIPTGQTWTVSSYTAGAANTFSYSTTRSGTTDLIKWFAATQITSVVW
jgi:hypothetical protein